MGAAGTETQTISKLGELRWFPSAGTRTCILSRGCPEKLWHLHHCRYSDTLTGPSLEQPDLVRPVLSRELH